MSSKATYTRSTSENLSKSFPQTLSSTSHHSHFTLQDHHVQSCSLQSNERSSSTEI
ncbi:hypothetical protein MHYP_G00207390 [Metynnis hypsauchen]